MEDCRVVEDRRGTSIVAMCCFHVCQLVFSQSLWIVVGPKFRFIKRTTAGSFSAAEVPLAMTEAMKKTGVAVIGLGRAGHFHMQSIIDMPGSVRLAWVIDVDTEKAKRIAAEKGCKWSNRLDEALEGPDAVDAVVIASVTDTHFPYIMQALRADKAVLAEKPISHELHEVEEAVQLAKNKNLAFVCGYQRRADRHFRELKRQLDAGAIGNLKLLKTCSRDNPIPPMEYLRTSGGIFHDMLIHDFDMLDFLSGGQVAESVTATGHSYHREIQDMGDVDICAVMFKYPSGLIAMVDTSRDASYGYDQRIEAFGEKGMLTAKNELTSTVELAKADGHRMPSAMYSFPQRYIQAVMLFIVHTFESSRFVILNVFIVILFKL